MKGIVLVPIILGVSLLTVGGIVVGVGYHNTVKEESVTNTHEVLESFSKIDIDVTISDVTFVTSGDDNRKVVCEETTSVVHEVKVEEDTLKVSYEDHRPWYDQWFNWSFAKRSVTISLPAGIYDDCVIHSDTGRVTLPSGLTFASLKVDTSTGDMKISSNATSSMKLTASTGNVQVEDAKPESLEVNTSTGNITLQDIEVTNDIKLKASTGSIKADNMKGDSLDAKCSTGGVTLTDTIITKHMNVKTSTGEIRLNDCDAETLTLKSDTGSIKGNLLTSKIFYASSDIGKVTVPHTTTGGKCEIETDTGEIYITVNE